MTRSNLGCSTVAVRSPRIKYQGLFFYLHLQDLFQWAMLGSNQRPLPCEGGAMLCWFFLAIAKRLQNRLLSRRRFS